MWLFTFNKEILTPNGDAAIGEKIDIDEYKMDFVSGMVVLDHTTGKRLAAK